MAQLSQSELQYCKYACGINQLQVGAEPLVSITRYFEQVVVPYLQYGQLTTCATAIAASARGSGPIPVLLMLADATGISMMDRVVVDVDSAREVATVQSITGNNIVVMLANAHGAVGAYPVEQEGGSSLVRQYIAFLHRIDDRIDRFGARAGVKKADEVEFFGGSHGRGHEPNGFKTFEQMRDFFRGQLSKLLFGVGDVGAMSGGRGSSGISLY